jgi:hypothetical protein
MRGNVTLWGAEPRILVDAQGPTRLSCEWLVKSVTETTRHCLETSFSSNWLPMHPLGLFLLGDSRVFCELHVGISSGGAGLKARPRKA